MTAMILASGLLSFAMIGGYRWLALRRQWLDHPNARSSHRSLVPRGAGMVFALIITAAALLSMHDQPGQLIGAALVFAVALVGWRDDLRGMPARLRFALYWLSAAGIAVLGSPGLVALAAPYPGKLAMLILGISLALVWLTNLYNFMDGINGIAGFEAVFVLGSIIALGADSAFNARFGPLLWVALSSIAGFLLWNFPQAKVFMGDAGSAYLGALLGWLMLWSLQLGGPSPFSWLILLAVFIADTGYTLAVRMFTGQRWHEAHRTHAYQRLSDRLHSHARTVLILAAVNALWLLPWAWVARGGGWAGLVAMTVAYAPLLVSAGYLRAGIPSRGAV